MPKILVCPIAFNEHIKLKNAIERFLRSKVRSQVDYLVIDDASIDGTSQIIESFSSGGVKTIRHPRRQGVGAAIRTAIRYAQKKGYEILVIMAGNDKDNPEEIPNLFEPILKEDYDFVQGSRYKGVDGTGGDMPSYRKMAVKVHAGLMGLITGKKVTDSTNGFRAFKVSIFKDERIKIDESWLDHYELEPYLLYKVLTLGYKFAEVPVTKIYPPKKLGYTKMRPILGWWSILKPLVYLGLRIKK